MSGMPPINALGPAAAESNGLLNKAIRLQLQYVRREASDYLEIGPMVDKPGQMPHEWGSLDSFDDMRNAMAVATALMDEFIMCDPQAQVDTLRRIIADRGVCATDVEVLELAWPGMIEDSTYLEELAKYQEDGE